MKKINPGHVLVAGCCLALMLGVGFGIGITLKATQASRNSAGTYSLATSPVTAGQVITPSLWNNTFNDLAADMTLSLDRNGRGGMLAPLRGIDGTLAAPALSFTSETGTGYWRNGAGDLRLSILGAAKGFWSATGLGIGAAPTYPLDVQSVVGATAARFFPSATFPSSVIALSTFGGLLGNLTHDGTNFKYTTSTGATAITYDNTGTTTVYTAPSGTAGNTATVTARLMVGTAGVTIGASGTPISGSFRGTATWNPGTLGACGAGPCVTATTNITVTGAATGAACVAGPVNPAPLSGFPVQCIVTATNTCGLEIVNQSNVSQTFGSATFYCLVFNP